jgi:hypothetical protein
MYYSIAGLFTTSFVYFIRFSFPFLYTVHYNPKQQDCALIEY